MSGKFMSVKRIILPTLTIAVIASQLMGCAALSKSELLTLLEQGDQIEIEVASPLIEEEQGEAETLDWIQLDQLQTSPELRKQMDDIFKIVPVSDTKNGVFYVDLEGNQNGNNTLYNTFMNNKFRNYWEDEKTLNQVADATLNTFVDIEEDEQAKAVYMAFSTYFNLLENSTPGYANPDSALTRLEAMAALFKAEHPVTDTLAIDKEFNAAVDSSNSNPNTIYASNLSEQSYLDISSGSLDNMTANGIMSRGEFVYMLVQQYFKSDYDSVDLKGKCYDDVTNGGDIASKQKFIEKGEAKKYWQSYELTYALQNPDQGCPERLYKALLVAFDKQIIQDEDSRWDEALSRSDFIELTTNAYAALPTITDSERGTMEELSVEIKDNSTQENTSSVDSTGSDVTIPDDAYVEPSESVEKSSTVQDAETEEAKQHTQKLYEAGIISKEDYEELMDVFNGNSTGKTLAEEIMESSPQNTYTDPKIAEMNERSKKYLEEHSTGNSTELGPQVDLSDVELPEHLRGKFIGN